MTLLKTKNTFRNSVQTSAVGWDFFRLFKTGKSLIYGINSASLRLQFEHYPMVRVHLWMFWDFFTTRKPTEQQTEGENEWRALLQFAAKSGIRCRRRVCLWEVDRWSMPYIWTTKHIQTCLCTKDISAKYKIFILLRYWIIIMNNEKLCTVLFYMVI